MTDPAPGGRPADAQRLAAVRSAADAVAEGDPGPDGVADPGAEADRFQTLHDALVDLLAAAEPEDTAGPGETVGPGETAGVGVSGPVPGSVRRGPG